MTAHDPGINWGDDTAGTRAVHLTRASTIVMRPVRWLWTQLLALGVFALLGGREGIGKSICAYTLAADLTRGRLPGACFGIPRAVIVAASEDSWEHTIVPRLSAAGADLERVYRVDVTTADDLDTALSLPRDMAAVGRAVRDVDAALIILDPLLSRLEGSLDTHKDADVRRALEPLASLAGSTGATVLGLIHVNKSTSTDPFNTLMASRAFAAVARSVLFVMTDPDDENVRLLGSPSRTWAASTCRPDPFRWSTWSWPTDQRVTCGRGSWNGWPTATALSERPLRPLLSRAETAQPPARRPTGCTIT